MEALRFFLTSLKNRIKFGCYFAPPCIIDCPKAYDSCYTLFDSFDNVIRRGCDFYRPEEAKYCIFYGTVSVTGPKSEFTRCQCVSDLCNSFDAFSLAEIAGE